MNWAHRGALWLYNKNLLRFLPWRTLKTYVYPLTVRGKKTPFSAKDYFDSYYQALEGFNNRLSIGPTISPLHAHYHYNATENSIIRGISRLDLPEKPSVIDVGSGAGHWIDFYTEVLNASQVTAIEISDTCAEKLKAAYPDLEVLNSDISEPSFSVTQQHDIVNAIGVMFHIVDDDSWQQAILNLSKSLKDGGTMIIGGQFGLISQNVQFHGSDNFNTLEGMSHKTGEIRVNKRIRSLRKWKRAVRRAGLRVEQVIRTHNDPGIFTPENNILIAVKNSGRV